MPAKTSRKKKPSETQELRTRLAQALGVTEEEAELRALRELLASVAPPPPARTPEKTPAKVPAFAPQGAFGAGNTVPPGVPQHAGAGKEITLNWSACHEKSLYHRPGREDL